MFKKPPHPGFHRRRESRLAIAEHHRASRDERRNFANQVVAAITGSLQAHATSGAELPMASTPANATTH